MSDEQIAFQDLYAEDVSHCYGCGRLNEHGLQIKTYWEGDETVTRYAPRDYHTAVPGFVYGGLLASLVDCHSTGTAAAAAFRFDGSPAGEESRYRFVTGSLHVDYLKPTPLGVPLEIRGRVEEVKGRKVVVSCTLSANGVVTAKGLVVAVRMPETFVAG